MRRFTAAVSCSSTGSSNCERTTVTNARLRFHCWMACISANRLSNLRSRTQSLFTPVYESVAPDRIALNSVRPVSRSSWSCRVECSSDLLRMYRQPQRERAIREHTERMHLQDACARRDVLVERAHHPRRHPSIGIARQSFWCLSFATSHVHTSNRPQSQNTVEFLSALKYRY